jgi:hypothetical protein
MLPALIVLGKFCAPPQGAPWFSPPVAAFQEGDF